MVAQEASSTSAITDASPASPPCRIATPAPASWPTMITRVEEAPASTRSGRRPRFARNGRGARIGGRSCLANDNGGHIARNARRSRRGRPRRGRSVRRRAGLGVVERREPRERAAAGDGLALGLFRMARRRVRCGGPRRLHDEHGDHRHRSWGDRHDSEGPTGQRPDVAPLGRRSTQDSDLTHPNQGAPAGRQPDRGASAS